MKPTESETADYVISPLTGEKIPANKIQEHMRIGEVVYTSLKLAAFMKCILWRRSCFVTSCKYVVVRAAGSEVDRDT